MQSHERSDVRIVCGRTRSSALTLAEIDINEELTLWNFEPDFTRPTPIVQSASQEEVCTHRSSCLCEISAYASRVQLIWLYKTPVPDLLWDHTM
jgi:hypothetical protein